MWKSETIGIQAALAVGLANEPSGDLSARVNRLLKSIGSLISLFVVSLSASNAAQSVTLAWDRNSEPDIAGYRLYYGTQPASKNQVVDAGNMTTATVSDLIDGTAYFFTVMAYNTAGLESQPSNEVSYTTDPLGAHTLTVDTGTGSGNYAAGSIVTVHANASSAGKKFERWMGDWVILSNPFLETTTATMPFQDVAITASYSDVPVSVPDQIRFHPRSGFTARMIGGVFEGANENPTTGTYTEIYTITSNPQESWTNVSISLGNYRYLRYRGPDGSYGNVAEIQFYRNGVRLTGIGYGTPGSYSSNGNTFAKALDGNIGTRFDGPAANGIYVGIDTGLGIRFYPRSGLSNRMIGGVFEGTNENPTTGNYTKIYTITSKPQESWTEVSVSLGNYRYLRYRGPDGSYGNVAEIQFYRNGVRLTGTGYGTPGSYSSNGNTFAKALDGNVDTRFDGPTANGIYVGIDTGSPAS